ncbi:hypothetical protein HDF16_005107 [Granulicella aggregans]|uniref:Uncharacterized protein n=1 Tax=Granulicella aggregans TaxID=474949 RepID=A0A7W7ZJK9_9BACT|nr:hypothetical protein [Granulicella aggregans]MBB5060371.1 hypothetical protein [Granulicella aggregans]
MYEALQPAQRVVERQPISLGRPAASPQPSSMIGGFTQLLRTLSSEEEVESRVEVRPLPAAQLLPQEQGEYTRIVSRSVMREASLRGHVQPPPEGATTPAPVENASKARSLSEATFSAVASSTAVAAPSIAPEANIAPQATPSRIQPSQPVEGDSLQRYLPLLLIANLFLTAVALIMLMVMLAHH